MNDLMSYFERILADGSVEYRFVYSDGTENVHIQKPAR